MKLLLYTTCSVFFVISVVGMFIYGYKTFYIEPEQVVSKSYAYHFALIAEESDNDYWRLVEKGAKQAAKESNVYLEYVAPKKADNSEVLKLFDRMISAKVDGIIIQGIEGERFIELVHKGRERGIPIITVDTDVKQSERQVYVGTDNFYAGQLTGKSIIENTTGPQYVGIVMGRFDAINQQERIAGFKNVVEAVDRIHIIDRRESNITEIGATQAAYSLLKQYPQINALIGTSALDGIGIVHAVNEIAPNEDIFITAFDVLPETMQLVRAGLLDATIAQYPKQMGKESVEVMIELQHHKLLDHKKFTETKIIQKQDLVNGHGGAKNEDD
ncbi:hypothetical protein CFK37_10265 [Virgibacillus phasianinus]|uniref:Periplasmic binding protein domain-containing protein n=1 Tax=Virgibacillus phasianinus TaxID=2017483 RepID=A0A220U2J6_9BACI|nr:sugar-binding protein [Virgibacillus phasianinus]ASK62504.1 hypothetical protein CFK37_10265 [Virgibacillus phasianinus]